MEKSTLDLRTYNLNLIVFSSLVRRGRFVAQSTLFLVK